MTWAVLAVACVAFVLALAPTRRLFLAGWRPAPLTAYLGILVALGVAAVFVRAGARVVIPALLVLYVLPFIGAPEVVARTVARIGGGRRPRVVEGRVVEGRAASVPERPPQEKEVGPGEQPSGPAGTDAGRPEDGRGGASARRPDGGASGDPDTTSDRP